MGIMKWCLGFVFSHSLRHVLLKKSRSLHVGLWNGVGGSLEKNDLDSSLNAMVRECKEESNIQTVQGDWIFVGWMRGRQWSCDLYANRDNHSVVAEYVHDLRLLEHVKPDKAIFIAVSTISMIPLAPYTGALVHMALDKLKVPLTPTVDLKIL